MSKIKKRVWNHATATEWIIRVIMGHEKRGLKYLSACDYLGVSPVNPMNIF